MSLGQATSSIHIKIKTIPKSAGTLCRGSSSPSEPTKICEDDVAFGIKEDVFQFEVSIDDPKRVKVAERKENLQSAQGSESPLVIALPIVRFSLAISVPRGSV